LISNRSPFVHHKLGAGHRVGIIGVGGLGHVGLQFAIKLGCHTVGISTSADKAKEIMSFGAHGFINSSDAKQMKDAAGTFDFLLSTISSGGINWDQYLDLLDTGTDMRLLNTTIMYADAVVLHKQTVNYVY
jgi:D-arabinose 1-dehydrogenase-like Zn-dependent alcohol dehydrogenase